MDRAVGTHHAEDLPRVPQPQPRQTTCSDSDFYRILDISPTWFQCFLLLCRVTGLRHNEARTLTASCYQEDTNTIIFDRKQSGTSNIPVTPELARMLKFAASQNPEDTIITTLGCPNNSKAAIHRKWVQLRTKAGVNPNLIIHDLRRTAATRVYNQTKDLRLAQQLLGHRNLTSTLHYITPLDTETLRAHLPTIQPRNLQEMRPATEVKQ